MAENPDAVELQNIRGCVEHYQRPTRPFKVSFDGVYNVGKTSLLRRILNEGFSDTKRPSFYGCHKHEQILDERETVVPFVFWDTVDVERFNPNEVMPYFHHRGSDFILLVYSADDEASLYELHHIVDELEQIGYIFSAKLILVRNKIDLPIDNHKVSEEREKDFLRKIKLKWKVLGNFWTSAKTNEGVENLLKELGKHSLKMFESRRQTEDRNILRLDSDTYRNNVKPKNQGFSCSG